MNSATARIDTTAQSKSVLRNTLSSVALFFLLTFVVTWACWLPVVLSSTISRPLSQSLWLVGTFAPSLVALAITAVNEGRLGIATLLGQIGRVQVAAGWYMFAIGYIAAIKLLVTLLHRVLTGAWPHFGDENLVLMLMATLISTPVQAGEEIGWRGYALPRLAQYIGYGPGALVLGVAWACWHLPQFFFAAADTYQQSFPMWSLEVIALSIAMAWLYTRTQGSLLLMMLMHAAVNNTKDIVPSVNASPTTAFSLNASLVMYLTVVMMWIASAYFFFDLRKRRSTGLVAG